MKKSEASKDRSLVASFIHPSILPPQARSDQFDVACMHAWQKVAPILSRKPHRIGFTEPLNFWRNDGETRRNWDRPFFGSSLRLRLETGDAAVDVSPTRATGCSCLPSPLSQDGLKLKSPVSPHPLLRGRKSPHWLRSKTQQTRETTSSDALLCTLSCQGRRIFNRFRLSLLLSFASGLSYRSPFGPRQIRYSRLHVLVYPSARPVSSRSLI